MAVTKKGRLIATIDDWRTLAPPKSLDQWRDGRSAKEAARAWLAVSSPALPPEVERALSSHADFGPVLEWAAEPEVRLPFDNRRGETRNTDLLVRARDSRGTFLLAVEAKVDESFSQTVSATVESASRRLKKNPRSKGVERVHFLVEALFGTSLQDEPSLGSLRYQLLTALAGALSIPSLTGGQRIVLMVQTLKTAEMRSSAHLRNEADIDAFLGRLSAGAYRHIESDSIVGPLNLPASSPLGRGTRFYLGKALRDAGGDGA